jgi:hypothetical protein
LVAGSAAISFGLARSPSDRSLYLAQNALSFEAQNPGTPLLT